MSIFIWMNPAKVFTDQLGRKIEISFPPKKIISIVPSQTELLFDLGLEEEVIGITRFCVHPEKWFRTKTRVGGTKKLNIEKIISMQPDLIIANKEENTEEQIQSLSEKFPMWVSDIKTLEDAFEMMRIVGAMTGKVHRVTEMVAEIKSAFSNHLIPDAHNPLSTAAYLIWYEPLMTIGSDTFIHSMMLAAGFRNVFATLTRYPSITLDELKAASPQYILLSSEPFPFKQKQVDELQQQLPSSKIILVDGKMFSWYGSRLLKAPQYFSELRESIY